MAWRQQLKIICQQAKQSVILMLSRQAGKQAGRQTTDRSQTGCMDVVVHYRSMCMLSDQSQHDGKNDVLGNISINAQEVHMLWCEHMLG